MKLPCCKPVCEGLKNVFSTRFCFYTAVTLGLNIPPVIFSAQSLMYLGCRGSQWLLINQFFCIAHIVAAFYLVRQAKSWNETVETLCYDPWVAAYFLVCVAFFIWLSIGAAWTSQGAMENGNCPGNISSLTMYSSYCGFAFVNVGSFVLIISFVFSWWFGKGKEQNQNNVSQKPGNYIPPVFKFF